MINHIKYAILRYSFWINIFAMLIGIIAILPICGCLAVVLVILCFALPFIIPFVASYRRQIFTIKTTGKSKVSFCFGDLCDEDYIVMTTNRYYDINPDGEYISDESLLGIFLKRYCSNIVELEESLKAQLRKDENNNIIPAEYGEYIKKKVDGRTVYFLVFTDRYKSDQSEDFYIKTVQGFFNGIVNENHGKTICISLLGGNNNLSNSGFPDLGIALRSLLAMISNFEIVNQRSELRLKIVALPEQRSELIDVIASCSK